MRQHFEDNGLRPDEHVLLKAAVGPEAGQAQWPEDADPRNSWGTRPIREDSNDDLDYLNKRTDRFINLPILAAHDLVRREPVWDMLHIDIQGWEGAVCRACIGVLSERVKWSSSVSIHACRRPNCCEYSTLPDGFLNTKSLRNSASIERE
jgi:hypothetical protein